VLGKRAIQENTDAYAVLTFMMLKRQCKRISVNQPVSLNAKLAGNLSRGIIITVIV
jgi:hypothetical protein